MHVTRPDRSEATSPANAEYFDGVVRMQPLVSEDQSGELELIAVFFESGARTIPHRHSTDQVLWVAEGTCVVADEAGRREVAPGECVFVPANRWHWHGAAPGLSACHVSIRKPGLTHWNVPRRDW